MASAEISRFMDNIRVRLPGALDDAIKNELYSALDEFFQTSAAWLEEIKFTTKLDKRDYDLLPVSGSQIVRLSHVMNADNIPVRATMPNLGCVRLDFAPAGEQVCTAHLIMTILDPVTREGYPQFPDWVLRLYREGLTDGVLGRMMSQIAKPYFNEKMSVYHLRRFRNAMAKARVDARAQHLQDGQRWKFPQSFSTVR